MYYRIVVLFHFCFLNLEKKKELAMNNYVLLILVFLAIGFVQSLSNAAPSNHVDPSEPIFDADIEPLVDTKEDGSRREGADEYSYMESLDNRVAHEGLDIRMVSEEENKGPYHLPEEFAVVIIFSFQFIFCKLQLIQK